MTAKLLSAHHDGSGRASMGLREIELASVWARLLVLVGVYELQRRKELARQVARRYKRFASSKVAVP